MLERILQEPMMKPVIVNEFGESIEAAFGDRALVDPPIDGAAHLYCSGTFDRHPVSETHAAYACFTCKLRLVLPIGVDTLEKLRENFKSLQKRM